eukprot:jgi/Ulvmu1/1534/UM011_0264.1
MTTTRCDADTPFGENRQSVLHEYPVIQDHVEGIHQRFKRFKLHDVEAQATQSLARMHGADTYDGCNDSPLAWMLHSHDQVSFGRSEFSIGECSFDAHNLFEPDVARTAHTRSDAGPAIGTVLDHAVSSDAGIGQTNEDTNADFRSMTGSLSAPHVDVAASTSVAIGAHYGNVAVDTPARQLSMHAHDGVEYFPGVPTPPSAAAFAVPDFLPEPAMAHPPLTSTVKQPTAAPDMQPITQRLQSRGPHSHVEKETTSFVPALRQHHMSAGTVGHGSQMQHAAWYHRCASTLQPWNTQRNIPSACMCEPVRVHHIVSKEARVEAGTGRWNQASMQQAQALILAQQDGAALRHHTVTSHIATQQTAGAATARNCHATTGHQSQFNLHDQAQWTAASRLHQSPDAIRPSHTNMSPQVGATSTRPPASGVSAFFRDHHGDRAQRLPSLIRSGQVLPSSFATATTMNTGAVVTTPVTAARQDTLAEQGMGFTPAARSLGAQCPLGAYTAAGVVGPRAVAVPNPVQSSAHCNGVEGPPHPYAASQEQPATQTCATSTVRISDVHSLDRRMQLLLQTAWPSRAHGIDIVSRCASQLNVGTTALSALLQSASDVSKQSNCTRCISVLESEQERASQGILCNGRVVPSAQPQVLDVRQREVPQSFANYPGMHWHARSQPSRVTHGSSAQGDCAQLASSPINMQANNTLHGAPLDTQSRLGIEVAAGNRARVVSGFRTQCHLGFSIAHSAAGSPEAACRPDQPGITWVNGSSCPQSGSGHALQHPQPQDGPVLGPRAQSAGSPASGFRAGLAKHHVASSSLQHVYARVQDSSKAGGRWKAGHGRVLPQMALGGSHATVGVPSYSPLQAATEWAWPGSMPSPAAGPANGAADSGMSEVRLGHTATCGQFVTPRPGVGTTSDMHIEPLPGPHGTSRNDLAAKHSPAAPAPIATSRACQPSHTQHPPAIVRADPDQMRPPRSKPQHSHRTCINEQHCVRGEDAAVGSGVPAGVAALLCHTKAGVHASSSSSLVHQCGGRDQDGQTNIASARCQPVLQSRAELGSYAAAGAMAVLPYEVPHCTLQQGTGHASAQGVCEGDVPRHSEGSIHPGLSGLPQHDKALPGSPYHDAAIQDNRGWAEAARQRKGEHISAAEVVAAAPEQGREQNPASKVALGLPATAAGAQAASPISPPACSSKVHQSTVAGVLMPQQGVWAAAELSHTAASDAACGVDEVTRTTCVPPSARQQPEHQTQLAARVEASAVLPEALTVRYPSAPKAGPADFFAQAGSDQGGHSPGGLPFKRYRLRPVLVLRTGKRRRTNDNQASTEPATVADPTCSTPGTQRMTRRSSRLRVPSASPVDESETALPSCIGAEGTTRMDVEFGGGRPASNAMEACPPVRAAADQRLVQLHDAATPEECDPCSYNVDASKTFCCELPADVCDQAPLNCSAQPASAHTKQRDVSKTSRKAHGSSILTRRLLRSDLHFLPPGRMNKDNSYDDSQSDATELGEVKACESGDI